MDADDLVRELAPGDAVVAFGSSTTPTRRKETGVAKEIDCPCGVTVRGDNDDELVANTEEHMRDKHPEMVGTKSREEILAMAHEA